MQIKYKRLFTLDEANRMLPLIRPITADIAETYQRLMDNCELSGSPNPDEIRGLDTAHREELGDVFQQIEADKKLLEGYVEELDRLGVQLKGPLEGLVDFPALRDGQVVLLCWKSGEPAVSHWHDVQAGFSGRQPIQPGDFAHVEPPALAEAGARLETRESRKDKQWNSSRSS